MTNIHFATVGLFVFSVLTGCATITTGSMQQLTIQSEPTAAHCVMNRDGEKLIEVLGTPEDVSIQRGINTITLVCRKAGYKDTAGV